MFGSFRHVCCSIFQHNRFLWPASYRHEAEGVNGVERTVCVGGVTPPIFSEICRKIRSRNLAEGQKSVRLKSERG